MKQINKQFAKILVLMCLVAIPQWVRAEGGEKATSSKKGTKDAAASAASDEKKDEFQARMRNSLNEIEANINEFKVRMGDASDKTKKKLNRDIETLQKQQRELKGKYEKLQASSERAWLQVKTGMERTLQEIRATYNRASAEFDRQEGKRPDHQMSPEIDSATGMEIDVD